MSLLTKKIALFENPKGTFMSSLPIAQIYINVRLLYRFIGERRSKV